MGAGSTPRLNWSVALRLGRVSNLPTVWTNVVAGVVLAGADPLTGSGLALVLIVSAFYVAGMYLNDAFDADFDRAARPSRPIPSGEVAGSTVVVAGFGLMGAGLLGLLAYGLAHRTGPAGAVTGAALCAAIVVYDLWHKQNPFGPVLMGLCRALAYATAAAAAAGAVGTAVATAGLTTTSYLVGLTYAAKQEDLARMGSLWPMLFLAAPFVYAASGATKSAVGLALIALLALAVGTAAWSMMRGARRSVSHAVALLIAGISLVDGLYIVDRGHTALAVLTIFAFALTLALQRVVPGT